MIHNSFHFRKRVEGEGEFLPEKNVHYERVSERRAREKEEEKERVMHV